MSSPPPTTTFVSRGKLSGVLHQEALGHQSSEPGDASRREGESNGSPELDTQTYEVLYYRARLVLGDSFPRPPRFQLRGH